MIPIILLRIRQLKREPIKAKPEITNIEENLFRFLFVVNYHSSATQQLYLCVYANSLLPHFLKN